MRIDTDTLRSHGGQQSWNGQRRKLFPWSLFYGFAHANVGFLSSNSESVFPVFCCFILNLSYLSRIQ